MATPSIDFESIGRSLEDFDLGAPLSEAELRKFGMLTVLPGIKIVEQSSTPLLRDLDETDDESVDVVAAAIDGQSYNVQYAYYLQCQALVALVSFDEGWKSFEELVLKSYVSARRRENKEYKGDDPNKAFSLRLREQAAEDFVRFIRVMVAEAKDAPKPVLAAKK